MVGTRKRKEQEDISNETPSAKSNSLTVESKSKSLSKEFKALGKQAESGSKTPEPTMKTPSSKKSTSKKKPKPNPEDTAVDASNASIKEEDAPPPPKSPFKTTNVPISTSSSNLSTSSAATTASDMTDKVKNFPLFIEHLSFTCTPEQVKAAFKEADVAFVNIIKRYRKNNATQDKFKMGFVHFASEEAQMRALNLGSVDIDGLKATLSIPNGQNALICSNFRTKMSDQQIVEELKTALGENAVESNIKIIKTAAIVFPSHEQASKAYAILRKTDLKGKHIAVKYWKVAKYSEKQTAPEKPDSDDKTKKSAPTQKKVASEKQSKKKSKKQNHEPVVKDVANDDSDEQEDDSE